MTLQFLIIKLFNFFKQEIQMMACKEVSIHRFFKPEVGVLISKMDFDNLCNQSVLLHEIIHALQYLITLNFKIYLKKKNMIFKINFCWIYQKNKN